MSDPDGLLRAALAQHQGGALSAACDLYRQVLAVRPGNHDALHLLGVARGAMGKTAEGIALIQQAIAVNPGAASPHFNLGGLFLAQGETELALGAFLACLAWSPNHVGALTAAARTLHTLGRSAEAVDRYARALTLVPTDVAIWGDLGATLTASGRLDEALRCYDQVLHLRPDHTEAHYNRGYVLLRQQAYDAAEAAFRAALAGRPDHLGAWLNLGFALEAQARGEEALAAFEHALTLAPENLAARLQRGLLLHALNRHADAVEPLTAVLTAAPDHLEALAARGSAFWVLEAWDGAKADLDRALALAPDHVPALIDRGNLFHDLQRYDAALACYNRALALDPDNLTALMNRGGTLQSLQRHAEALETYQKALAVRPGYDDALMSVSLCQLRAGAWCEGWRGYETRLRQQPWTDALPTFSGPRWDGASDLRGKRVLLASEQGLGDAIQFSRFARFVADRGARVILGVEKPLRRLMRGLAGVSEIAVPGEPAPVYDCYVPLMSLIAVLDLGMEDVATGGPYLHADPDAAAAWRTRLAALPGLKIGLAWAGDPRRHNRTAFLMDRRRSIALERLAPLLAVDGVTFVSLQKGAAAVPPIIDWTDELDDFADTAALIDGLDLVITVDTAVAHTAGALGKPVWMLNRFDRCWRWMWDRTDTPWYPTMRLFTQRVPGVWKDVVSEVAAMLVMSDKPR
ncbi:tetratricopeptide repeat protein [Acidisphaera sp. S103]|uniref:tetratricopeptide repeat protein n=1 Tax=Acidisphaera sp. S103 TaxID=1747223 RepID=UPI00131ACAC7|nr:tetratricopeptide repeat protein [Acidisphaera sp. S103]